MNPSLLLFLSLIGITVSIIVGGGGGGRGHFDDDSRHYSGGRDSSDSSDSHEHHPHPHRPPRPSRPNPPRELTKCPDNWMLFKRPQGNWCVGLYNALIDQLSAEQRCRTLNATLTGLQTNEERMKLADAARALLLPTSVTDAAIWLGAKRKPECPRAGICLPKDTFNWTDGHTTGTDGFVYFPGEPNGKIDNTWGVQSCIHQLIFPRGPTHWFWVTVTHGELDDTFCQEANVFPGTKLYACGKKATR